MYSLDITRKTNGDTTHTFNVKFDSIELAEIAKKALSYSSDIVEINLRYGS